MLAAFFDYFSTAGTLYTKAGLDALNITVNLNEKSVNLDKKYNSFVINLPTLYNTMDEALTEIDKDFMSLSNAFENLLNSFWGPYATT